MESVEVKGVRGILAEVSSLIGGSLVASDGNRVFELVHFFDGTVEGTGFDAQVGWDVAL